MAAWMAVSSLAHAQDESSTATFDSPQPSAHSFDIRVEAPEDIKDLLERHLQLQRFRAVTDLEDAELARLMNLAETDVRQLVGTLGYFSPDIQISRKPVSTPPTATHNFKMSAPNSSARAISPGELTS